MRRTSVGIVGPLAALVLSVSSTAVASPSVQVSEQFVKVAKRAFKELAEKTFESRACKGNLTCEAFVETLFEAAVNASTSEATAIFDKLADSVLRIGLDYLVDRHILPLQKDLVPSLPDACTDTVGKARRELAGCLAARLLRSGRVDQCRLESFLELAKELEKSSLPAAKRFAMDARTLKTQTKGYHTPRQQSLVAAKAAGMLVMFLWDSTYGGFEMRLRLERLRAIAGALEKTAASQPTDFFGTALMILDSLEQELVSERRHTAEDLSPRMICRDLRLFKPERVKEAFGIELSDEKGDGHKTVTRWLAVAQKCCPNPPAAAPECPVHRPEGNPEYGEFVDALSGMARLPVRVATGSLVKAAGVFHWTLTLIQRDSDDLRRLRPWLLTAMALVDYLRQEDGGTLLARRMLGVALSEVVDATRLGTPEADAIKRLAETVLSEPADPAESLKQLLAGLSGDSLAALKKLVRDSDEKGLCSCPLPGTGGAGSPVPTSPCDLENCLPSTAEQFLRMAVAALAHAAREHGGRSETADMLLAASRQDADAVRHVRELAVQLVAGEVSDAMSEAIKSAVHTDNGAGEVVQELVTNVLDTMLDVVVGRGEGAASTSQRDLLKALEKLSGEMDGLRLHLTLGPSIAWTSSPWLSSEQATDSQRNQIHLTVLDLYGAAYQWRSGFYVGLAVGGFLDDLERTLGLEGSEETYPLWRLALVGGYRFGKAVPISLEVTAGGAFPADTKEEYWNRSALAASFNVTLPVDMVLGSDE